MPTISTLTVDITARTSRLRASLRGAGLLFGALGAAAGFAFHEFEKSEQIANQTAAVIKSTGGAAKVTAGQVAALGQALMKKSGIDDETIVTGANMLLTFRNIRNEVGLGNKIFDRATSAALDMSVALGTDMASASKQLGKALQDPTIGLTALRRSGVTFSKSQSDLIKKLFETGHELQAQKLILKEVNREFSGSAAAQKTASQTMATAMGELAETAGELLAPAVTFLLEKVTAFAQFLQANLGPALQAIGSWFVKLWESVGPVVTVFGRELLEAAQQIWDVFKAKLLPTIKKLWDSLKPLVKVIGAVVGVILLLALEVLPVLFNVFATWISVMAGVVTWIADELVGPIVGFFQRLFHRIQDILGNIKGAWKLIWGAVKTFFIGIWDGIKGAMVTAVNFMIGILNGLIDGINAVLEGIAKIGTFGLGSAPNIPHIPTLGGSAPPVTGPPGTGHGGASGGRRGPEGGGGTAIVNIQLGDETLERVVLRGLELAARRS